MYYILIKIGERKNGDLVQIVQDWQQALDIIKKLDADQKEIKINFKKLITK